jgi:hypothetical protein
LKAGGICDIFGRKSLFYAARSFAPSLFNKAFHGQLEDEKKSD